MNHWGSVLVLTSSSCPALDPAQQDGGFVIQAQRGKVQESGLFAHAALDVSDGLAGDLLHILERSRMCAEIDIDAVPRSEAVRKLPQDAQRQCVLAGGDDYELLFTAPPDLRDPIMEAGARANVAVTRIGTITALRHPTDAPTIAWRDASHAPLSLTLHGFDHFDAN